MVTSYNFFWQQTRVRCTCNYRKKITQPYQFLLHAFIAKKNTQITTYKKPFHRGTIAQEDTPDAAHRPTDRPSAAFEPGPIGLRRLACSPLFWRLSVGV